MFVVTIMVLAAAAVGCGGAPHRWPSASVDANASAAVASNASVNAWAAVDPEASAHLERRHTIVIYGAEWCGPCQQAAAFLSLKGVRFVERNIETDHGAANEMHSKLTRAGLRGGAIPVLDVDGRILVGFNPQAVDRALKPL